MSRNNGHSNRLNIDPEDDSYLNTSLSTSSINSRSPKDKNLKSFSSDDSDDQDRRVNNRVSKAAHNSESQSNAQTATRPTMNVRKVSSNRMPIQRDVSEGSTASQNSSPRGFVPKDPNIKFKPPQGGPSVTRGAGLNPPRRTSRTSDSGGDENPSFGLKAPKMFLDEPQDRRSNSNSNTPRSQQYQQQSQQDDVRGSHSSWTSARGNNSNGNSREDLTRQQDHKPQQQRGVSRNDSSSNMQSDSARNSRDMGRPGNSYIGNNRKDESEDEDDDTRSQMSSNTVEDFNNPTPEKRDQKETRGGKKKENRQQNSRSQEEEDDLQSGDNLRRRVPGPKGGHVQRDSFTDYVERSEAAGIMLPRKSGRYDENEDGAGSRGRSSKPNSGAGRSYRENSRDSSSDRQNDDDDEQDKASGEDSDGSEGNWLNPSTRSSSNSNSDPRLVAAASKGSESSIAMNFSSSGRTTPTPPVTYVPNAAFSFVLVAHPRGLRTEHVQCTVRRDRTSMQGKLYPTYEMVLEDPKKTLIIARKMNLNRTSNYHLFDMTRGQAGSKLSKKNGNYLGKLRAKNIHRTEYILQNQSSEREEMAGVLFDRLSLLSQIKDGNQPRKMKVLIPSLDANRIPSANKTGDNDSGSLSERLIALDDCDLRGETLAQAKQSTNCEGMFLYQSKDPVFENGNYRLNFNGRVSMPSVKNYQLVAADAIDDIICQFGKVDEDVFHLDYKAPLNAFQAFAFALCQFNL